MQDRRLATSAADEPRVPQRRDRPPLGRRRGGPLEPRPRRGVDAGASSLLGRHDELVEVAAAALRRRRRRRAAPRAPRRAAPSADRRAVLVTTVFDLLFAQYGVAREAAAGRVAGGLRRRGGPYTPAWQEPYTGVDRRTRRRGSRASSPRNAERTGGALDDHHGRGREPLVPRRPRPTAAMLTAAPAVAAARASTAAGWATTSARRRCARSRGWSTVAFALDWARPAAPAARRRRSGTCSRDQWRYETLTSAGEFDLARGQRRARAGAHMADRVARAARLGWLPFYPQFDRNPLDVADEAADGGREADAELRRLRELQARARLRFAVRGPGRAGELAARSGSSGGRTCSAPRAKGHEYFLRHYLGVPDAAIARRSAAGERPRDVVWRDSARGEARPRRRPRLPHGRLARSTRTSSCRRPPGTRRTTSRRTDMHPFIHPLNAAVPPPLGVEDRLGHLQPDRRSAFSELADDAPRHRAPTSSRRRSCTTRRRSSRSAGGARLAKGECEPVPGKTMPGLVVGRARLHGGRTSDSCRSARWSSRPGSARKGVSWKLDDELDELRAAQRARRRRRRPGALPARSRRERRARRSSRCRADDERRGSRSRASARWRTKVGTRARGPRRGARATCASRSPTSRASRAG